MRQETTIGFGIGTILCRVVLVLLLATIAFGMNIPNDVLAEGCWAKQESPVASYTVGDVSHDSYRRIDSKYYVSINIAGSTLTGVTVTNGKLLVDGSDNDDTIIISPAADVGVVLVNVNGNTQTVSGVTSIEVRGNEGDDTITVNGRLPSSLFGNEGDDTIFGSAGPDYIEGGIGADNINAREGQDTIYASAPGLADTAPNTIQGGRSNDEIFGSQFSDTIFGGEANDTIYAFAGADEIFGGQGADTIFAGDGNDVIRAGESADTVYGQNGNDTIIGGLGFDLLFGGNGDDVITGGDGQDTLNGGAGSDILSGNVSNVSTAPGVTVISDTLSVGPVAIDSAGRAYVHTHQSNAVRLLRFDDFATATAVTDATDIAANSTYRTCLLYTSPSPRDS